MRALLLVLLAACGGAAPAQPSVGTEAKAAKAEGSKVAEAKPADAAKPVEPKAAAAAPDTNDGAWPSYGAAWQTGQITPVAQLLDTPQSFVGKPITVEGTVTDVCQKKGCWMVVTDGSRTMRVTMKDHAFGVAFDASGNIAHVQGELVAKPVDPKTVEHFREESAKKEGLPEDSAKDGMSYELVASSVKLKRATQ